MSLKLGFLRAGAGLNQYSKGQEYWEDLYNKQEKLAVIVV